MHHFIEFPFLLCRPVRTVVQISSPLAKANRPFLPRISPSVIIIQYTYGIRLISLGAHSAHNKMLQADTASHGIASQCAGPKGRAYSCALSAVRNTLYKRYNAYCYTAPLIECEKRRIRSESSLLEAASYNAYTSTLNITA